MLAVRNKDRKVFHWFWSLESPSKFTCKIKTFCAYDYLELPGLFSRNMQNVSSKIYCFHHK